MLVDNMRDIWQRLSNLLHSSTRKLFYSFGTSPVDSEMVSPAYLRLIQKCKSVRRKTEVVIKGN